MVLLLPLLPVTSWVVSCSPLRAATSLGVGFDSWFLSEDEKSKRVNPRSNHTSDPRPYTGPTVCAGTVPYLPGIRLLRSSVHQPRTIWRSRCHSFEVLTMDSCVLQESGYSCMTPEPFKDTRPVSGNSVFPTESGGVENGRSGSKGVLWSDLRTITLFL